MGLGFNLSSRVYADAAAIEYRLGTDGEAYALGETLKHAGGRLTKAAGGELPEFICQRAQAAEATAAKPLAVMRVATNQEYESTFAAEAESVAVGDVVTIHTDGLRIGASTDDGVFRISHMEGSAAGSKVRGYFAPVFARPDGGI
jgi:hypothetical protein